jgi:DNA-binding MarR family transcriptional regulator
MPNPTPSHILIDKFWESVPPAWRQTRSQIRHIAIEKFQMTEEQFQVLRRIRKGSTSVSALAEASQTSRSAVSKVVDALVRRGLVTRSQDPQDRRNLPLALTEEGQRVMDLIFGEAEAWLSARFARITAEETKCLLRGMESLRKAFSNP